GVRPALVYSGAVAGESRGAHAMSPPVARSDDLAWLRDDEREAPEVLRHLEAENAYTAAMTAAWAPDVEALYQEFRSRMKETDAEAPYRHGAFMYYSATVEGEAYPRHCRRLAGVADAREEIVLDENAVAAGNKMCDVHAVEVSPDHSLVAYAVDFSGSEEYDVMFKATSTRGDRAVPTDVLHGVASGVEWGADCDSVYYQTMDDTHRPYRVYRHVMGTPQEEDVLLYEEADERFWVEDMRKTRSGDFIFVVSASKVTSEAVMVPLTPHAVQLLQASHPDVTVGAAIMVQPRRDDVLYHVNHFRGGTWWWWWVLATLHACAQRHAHPHATRLTCVCLRGHALRLQTVWTA
ncbi:hypothetical protein EON62_00710, partial [archaeon]